MSGHKRATVTLSLEEYQRLRDADIKLRTIPAPAQEIHQQIHQESQEGIRRSLAWMEQRQSEFQSTVEGFNTNLRELELATSQALLQQQTQLVEQIEQQNSRYQEAVCSLGKDVSNSLNQIYDQVLQEHQRNQEHLGRFERKMNKMAGDLQRKVEYAGQWLDAAEQLCTFIKSHYSYAFFLPGEVERLENSLLMARENLEVGMPEAVVVTAQQVYAGFSEMRVVLERMTNEWLMAYYAAWESLCQLHALVLENQTAQAIDMDGSLLDLFLNVDFWSEGQWSALMNEVERLLGILEDQEAPQGVQPLVEVVQQTVPEAMKRLEQLVFEARVAVLNSQLRINIADLVIQALREQGFVLEESSYHGTDMRLPYSARLVGYDGGEVIVQVSPTGKGLGENQLQLDSLDQGIRTQHELLQRWREINRSLAKRGLTIRQQEILSDTGKPQPRGWAALNRLRPRLRGNQELPLGSD